MLMADIEISAFPAMYAMSIRDGAAREYEFSLHVSQMRCKTRLRRAMSDQRNPTRESVESLLYRLPKGIEGNLNNTQMNDNSKNETEKNGMEKPSTSTSASMKITGNESKSSI